MKVMATGFRTTSTFNLSEKFKGFFAGGVSVSRTQRRFYSGENKWLSRCNYYDLLMERHPLAKAQILTIGGQLMADGIFLNPKEKQGKPYPQAEEACRKCEDLNREVGMELMLHETGITVPKYGSCFWEKTFSPKFSIRVIPGQKYIEPEHFDVESNIDRWKQTVNGNPHALWSVDQIIHFPWNVTTQSWPYGTSMMVGLDTEFAILEELETDIKEYMHKNAFPKELWQVGNGQFMPTASEQSVIASKVKNWEPGDHFVTSYPIAREAGGTGDRKIESLDSVLNYLKDQCIDGLMVPPISRQWSSTEASAKEMMPWARTNLILPLQRIIKYKLEHEVYKPYLEDLGFSVKVCPEISFESPDAHKEEEAEYYSKLVIAGVMPPKYAAKELGVPEEEFIEWQHEEEEREERAFKQQEKLGQESEKQEHASLKRTGEE